MSARPMLRQTFDCEPWAVVQPQLHSLIQQHYQEIAWKKDKIKLNPDWKRYEDMERAGVLKTFTVREDGALIGYAIFFVRENLHYNDVLWAANDIVFVRKDKRGLTGIRLLKYAEQALRKMGCHVVSMHIKREHDWGRLAGRLGYEHTEANYWKWIGD